jgi:dethiobiotin synthase
MKQFFITGTDTGVGKTIVSAIITKVLQGCYWKPIQSGLANDEHDKITVKKLTDLSDQHFFSSIYELQASLSPHHAAELENTHIDIQRCQHPPFERALIVEGAGGVFVPVNDKASMLDLMKHLNFPVILVTRGTLGTINHTLLTIHTLRQHDIPIHGIVFNGELYHANQKTIEQWSGVKTLFHVPYFENLEKSSVGDWLKQHENNILAELL